MLERRKQKQRQYIHDCTNTGTDYHQSFAFVWNKSFILTRGSKYSFLYIYIYMEREREKIIYILVIVKANDKMTDPANTQISALPLAVSI